MSPHHSFRLLPRFCATCHSLFCDVPLMSLTGCLAHLVVRATCSYSPGTLTESCGGVLFSGFVGCLFS